MATSSPKTMFFKDCSLLVVFDAYLGSWCTIPDIYSAGLVVIPSLRTALGSLKEVRVGEDFSLLLRNVCQLSQRYL